MPGFSADLHEAAAEIWERIFHHPFLTELLDGTLPIASFRYFLAQDYQYLGAFGKAVALLMAKSPDDATLRRLGPRVLTPVERPLHARLFEIAGVTLAEVEAREPAPTNVAYMNHMLTTAALADPGVAAAALLPCPWSYHAIGERVAEHGVPRHPVYAQWAAFYAEGMLAESTRAWRAFVDDAAAEAGPAVRTAMRQAFIRSSRYEYLFWDAAHKREQWPI